jgi:branched-subunit amino acid transport protein
VGLWLTIIAVGIVTVVLRVSFILLLGHIDMPGALLRMLRYVPPAVLSALIVPELVVQQERIVVGWQNPRLIAGVIAALIAWRTKNVLLTIAVGMIVLWLAQAVLVYR